MPKDETVQPEIADIKLDHDKLITQYLARIAEQHARGSDASESAAETKKFLEETGLNSQAHSWGMSILKKLPKKDGQHKAMDIIRSLHALLPLVENHVMGQGTSEMQLEGDGEPDPDGEDADLNNDITPDDDGEETDVDEAVADLEPVGGEVEEAEA